MVGRDRELARVTLLLDDALAGGGRLVLCTGEAGIGKTRLADEASAVLLADVVRQLRGTLILVLATYRESAASGDTSAGLLPRLSADANTERVDLRGLPVGAVGDMLLAAGLPASAAAAGWRRALAPVGEVAVQRGRSDPGAPGDLSHRDVGVRIGERGTRSVKDPLPVALGVDPSGRWQGCRCSCHLVSLSGKWEGLSFKWEGLSFRRGSQPPRSVAAVDHRRDRGLAAPAADRLDRPLPSGRSRSEHRYRRDPRRPV